MTEVIKELSEAKTNTAALFERQEREGAGRIPVWLNPLRKAALSRFTELGYPTRRDEEWRYTHIGPIAETNFGPTEAHLTAEQLAQIPLANLPCNRLVFVNGKYAPELSDVRELPEGVQVGSLAQILSDSPALLEPNLARYATFEKQPFVALNTAFLADGAFVLLPRNAVVDTPIHLLYLSTTDDAPAISHPRTLLVAGENSQATLVESYISVGTGVTFSNAVTEVVLADNAVVDHYKITQMGDVSYHIGTMQILLAKSSNFASHNITLAGAIVRHDANAVFHAEGCECTLNGLYLARGKQIVDNHTAIDHAMPHCNSHELYKGILDDQARGVFNGKIFVRLDAQKTDAKQTNQTLLLSKDATINTKPQLEIFADDVRCTHGATIGQLDAESLFYLRARGIGAAEARSLLTHAFASDVIDRIKFAPLRTEIHRAPFAHLPHEIRDKE